MFSRHKRRQPGHKAGIVVTLSQTAWTPDFLGSTRSSALIRAAYGRGPLTTGTDAAGARQAGGGGGVGNVALATGGGAAGDKRGLLAAFLRLSNALQSSVDQS
jgi:hypothetical protein